MDHDYTYRFPSLRGIQAGREYFVAMCPLKLLPKLFLFNESPVPPELRAQRTLNNARVPEIAEYILSNRDNYAFSAITASIDGEVQFEPAENNGGVTSVGWLNVSMSAKLIINDGQHRRAAIEAALEKRPDLAHETIAVVFYLDCGLQRSQQLFADLNKNAVRPTKSLGILYDYRDSLAALAREVTSTVSIFKGLTEFERTTISNRSTKFSTLNAIYQATGALLGKSKNEVIRDEEKSLVLKFWEHLTMVLPGWQMVVNREVSAAKLRREYVHAHAVVLHALGMAGRDLLKAHPQDWTERLELLKKIDWSRENPLWEGCAMIGGHMSKTPQSVQMTATLIKKLLEVELNSDDKRSESYLISPNQHQAKG